VLVSHTIMLMRTEYEIVIRHTDGVLTHQQLIQELRGATQYPDAGISCA
jgi:hypothetical protein